MALSKRIIPTFCAFILAMGIYPLASADQLSGITLYVAKDVITLSEATPKANAVAVRNGRILEVGDADTLHARYKGMPSYERDSSFANQVMVPGFIDPHLHLWLMALLLPMEFITPADWELPWGDAPGVSNEQEFLGSTVIPYSNTTPALLSL